MAEHDELREATRRLCARFGDAYWRECDETKAHPEAFLAAFIEAGFVSTLVPEADGGAGLGVAAGAAILEEMHASGADGAIAHAAMNAMTAFVRHGSAELKARYLPAILDGTKRFLSFAVTEPDAGSDTTRIRVNAVREGDRFRVDGRKVWISHAAQTDLQLLLVRTAPRDPAHPTDGLSILLVDVKAAIGNGLSIRPIPTTVNHHSTECTYDDLPVPADHLVGPEGQGFRCIFDGMNAERILIAAECVGDATWFVREASDHARTRRVFDRPIGQNQAVQFPLAEVHAETYAARLAVFEAARMFDRNEPCGEAANIAKLLASRASYKVGDVCLQTLGGMGFASELGVQRKFRESRLYPVAPVSNNLILSYLAQRILRLPKAY